MLAFQILTLLALSFAGSKGYDSSAMFEKYVLSHDMKTHLFSECADNLHTVDAVIYSIPITNGSTYVRYRAMTLENFEYRTVELSSGAGIVECALEAGKTQAGMFKYDEENGCRLYDGYTYIREAEQACTDEEAADIVYLCNGGHCPVRFHRDCYVETADGLAFDHDGTNILVSEARVPHGPPDCCPFIIDGTCYTCWGDCSDDLDGDIDTCHASTICDHMGWENVPLSFFLNNTYAVSWDNDVSGWVDFYTPIRKINDLWINIEDGSIVDEMIYPLEIDDTSHDCINIDPEAYENGFDFESVRCNNDAIDGAICIQRNTQLPLC